MKNKTVQLTMRNYLQERKQIPGFVRRMKSSLERFGMKMQSEWAEQERRAAAMVAEAERRIAERKAEHARQEERREAVVLKARNMIEWAHASYEDQKARHAGNIKLLTKLTLYYSPVRVMSLHQHFGKLCEALFNDAAAWSRLTRDEKRFISDAFKLLKAEERASIAGAFIAGAVAG